jgi:hypothetical protein
MFVIPRPLNSNERSGPTAPQPTPLYSVLVLLFPKGLNILLDCFHKRKLFKSKYECSETETFRNFLNWKIIYEFPCS